MLNKKLTILAVTLLALSSVFANTNEQYLENFWNQNGGVILRVTLAVLVFIPFFIISGMFESSEKKEFKIIALVMGLSASLLVGLGLDNATIESVRMGFNEYSPVILIVTIGIIAFFIILRQKKSQV
ncbi:MAG: hypothetical protein PHW96_02705 [Candidatus Nanoarchaeia archaeon]|nr:hypothetical protein [Candidatus Nanoarchaeia archaeon]